MEKKNRLITLKTFEEFKSDNANHYADVLTYFKQMLEYINKNGVNEVQTKYSKMVDAGQWKIEGSIDATDLRSEDDTLDTEIIFHNDNEQDSIMVHVTGYGETTLDEPGDWDTPPEFESESHLTIESVTLWTEDGGNDFSIAVGGELETVLTDIINKIAK